jgi:hypothetical protein
MQKKYKFSPSELTFLWDECPRCFYLKHVYDIKRPAAPFPSIFGAIDRAMKEYYGGRPTSDIHPSLPQGIVLPGENWVESIPIEIPGCQSRCYFRGKYDTLLQFEDGSYGVVDFKTSDPKPEHVAFYSRQLHAYALSLEKPAPGKFSLGPISVMGLLSIKPRSMDVNPDGQVALLSNPTWQAVPRDDDTFYDFIARVLTLLDQPEPPPPSEECGFCKYREGARQYGW